MLYIEYPENAYSRPPIRAFCGFVTNLRINTNAKSDESAIFSASSGAIRYWDITAGNSAANQKNGLPSV